MKNNSARKQSSRVVRELLSEITPVERMQTSTKMMLAARIDDLLAARGLGKSEFAAKVNKNPSEITKWLGGTHNFTIDTLTEIAVAFDLSVAELFAPKPLDIVDRVQVVVRAERAQPALPYHTPLREMMAGRNGDPRERNKNSKEVTISRHANRS
ncbi:MAG TPA: helix-turn-helix transcriptional regulator [Puia sp.]|nr:helix-turn-helix transcriptional regulator [Puia sp.]